MLEKLGPYRIERLLGRGGMGTVYAGVHEVTGERAAIKALSQVLADDGNFRGRFLAEIETLKQLKHPNIVQLLGDGEHDGHLFYVMELVEGQTLQEELHAGHRFDWREATRIAIEVCQALKHAHDHGIIHRDLKPANLLRGADGVIKLSDFGIAKLFGATHLTADGSVVGTADYMAPEQAEGRPVSNRTDLYSLGNVLFTLLTRSPPFRGGSIPQVLHKLRFEEAPSVRRFAPDVPAELEQIISQLLRKDPQERIATALVLSNRLKAMEHAYASGTAIAPAPAAPAPAKPTQPAASRPTTDERATRISESRPQQPVTEISPTTVDPRNGRPKSDDYSWNEATAVTADSDASLQSAPPPQADTVVDGEAGRNRFATVDEQRQQQLAARASSRSWSEFVAIVMMALAFVGLVVGVTWGLLPRSADELYDRIAPIAKLADVRDAKEDIDEFLARHGDDPRAPQVREWLLDINSQFLFSRLRNRAKREQLSPVQDAYVEAMKAAEKDARAGRELFAKLIDKYGAAPDEADPITCVEGARHQVKRIDERLRFAGQSPGT